MTTHPPHMRQIWQETSCSFMPGDDNVHFQNSMISQDALIKAGKQFRSFYYPDKHHSIQGEKTKFHLYTMSADFVLENL